MCNFHVFSHPYLVINGRDNHYKEVFQLFILCVLLVVSLTILIYLTYIDSKKYRVLSKIITSILFLAIAVLSYLNHNCNFSYFLFIILGLVFSLFGDVFLAFNKDNGKMFILGLFSFCITHVFYYVAFNHLTDFSIVYFLISIAFGSVVVIGMKLMKFLDFGKLFKIIVLYTYIISFMLFKAISLYSYHAIWSNLIIVGAILFTISDMILSFVLFYKDCPKFMESLNLATYYIGQMIIALSIGYMF